MSWEVLSLNDSIKWENYFNQLPVKQQDIYFHPNYYKIYKEYGDGEPLCFVYLENEELALYPFLKNKINKDEFNLSEDFFDIQGAYGYNGVISSSYQTDFINGFYEAFEIFCSQENIIAEFTRFHPLLENYEFSNKHLTVIKDRKTVWLELGADKETRWKESYSGNNRNMIRKALKNEIGIEKASKESDYQLFYDIYLSTMKEVGASSYYFFNEEYALNFNSFLNNKQILLVADYQGQKICAMLLMLHGEYAHYHLSGRVREFSKLAANNLILDEAIEIAKEQGAKFFHFGGGNSNDLNDPLFKFKSNFSKDLADFYIGKKAHNKEVYEEICSNWETKFPDLKDKYRHFLLKYRQTN
jgi:hypothetical protein